MARRIFDNQNQKGLAVNRPYSMALPMMMREGSAGLGTALFNSLWNLGSS
jgi:hypothetical protein